MRSPLQQTHSSIPQVCGFPPPQEKSNRAREAVHTTSTWSVLSHGLSTEPRLSFLSVSLSAGQSCSHDLAAWITAHPNGPSCHTTQSKHSFQFPLHSSSALGCGDPFEAGWKAWKLLLDLFTWSPEMETSGLTGALLLVLETLVNSNVPLPSWL